MHFWNKGLILPSADACLECNGPCGGHSSYKRQGYDGRYQQPINKDSRKGDAFLPRISWEIELLHEISLKKKPTIVYPMNNPWYVTMSTATTLRITLDGVLGD